MHICLDTVYSILPTAHLKRQWLFVQIASDTKVHSQREEPALKVKHSAPCEICHYFLEGKTMSTPSWITGSLTFVTSGSNWGASFFTKACHHHRRCSPWGAGRPWHGGTLHVISVIVPTAWPQGGRLSQQFLWCGQVPTTTPALCLFKWLLLLWDQWPGEKLDWTLELDYFTSRQRMKKRFSLFV